jgi:hypothetical protein
MREAFLLYVNSSNAVIIQTLTVLLYSMPIPPIMKRWNHKIAPL